MVPARKFYNHFSRLIKSSFVCIIHASFFLEWNTIVTISIGVSNDGFYTHLILSFSSLQFPFKNSKEVTQL